jgi:hypothetical protein
MNILEKPKRRAAECRAGGVLVNRRNSSNRQEFRGLLSSRHLTTFVALLRAVREGIVRRAVREFAAE